MKTIRNDNKLKTKVPTSSKLSLYQSKKFGKQIFRKFNETCKYSRLWQHIYLPLQKLKTRVTNCHCIKAKDSVSRYSK
jgi:hypothetical protein